MSRSARRRAERRAHTSATSGDQPAPNLTSVPGALNETSVATWMRSQDATTVEAGDEDRETYAESPWGLIDKHIMRKGGWPSPGVLVSTPVIFWVGLTGWMLVQDNGAGRLETAVGVTRFVHKATLTAEFISAGTLVILIIASAMMLAKRAARLNLWSRILSRLSKALKIFNNRAPLFIL